MRFGRLHDVAFVDDERPVVGRHQARHMAADQRGDLHVPDRRGGDQPPVDLVVGGTEDVRPGAERVGDQGGRRLALGDEQRKVVREQVPERDRDDRVDEAPAELARVVLARTDCMPLIPIQ